MKAVRLFKKSVGGLIGWISEAWEETEHVGDFEINSKMEINGVSSDLKTLNL